MENYLFDLLTELKDAFGNDYRLSVIPFSGNIAFRIIVIQPCDPPAHIEWVFSWKELSLLGDHADYVMRETFNGKIGDIKRFINDNTQKGAAG